MLMPLQQTRQAAFPLLMQTECGHGATSQPASLEQAMPILKRAYGCARVGRVGHYLLDHLLTLFLPFAFPPSCLFRAYYLYYRVLARCVLYEMACLRHAFEGSDMRLLVMKICGQEPRPISARSAK